MDKLKVIIPLNENYQTEVGGGFSYYSELIRKIDSYSFDNNIHILFSVEQKKLKLDLQKEILYIPKEKIAKQVWTLNRRFKRKLRTFPIIKKIKRPINYENYVNMMIQEMIEKYLKQQKVDLIYYPTPNESSYNYPHIMTHWDLGHKSMYPFPEVSMNNKFEARESYHRINLAKAFAIFTESEKSKQELVHYEKINPSRIFVVPMFTGGVIHLSVEFEKQNQLLHKWKLKPNKFFFYPAQFWAHKNHYNLIKAFKIVKEQKNDIKLVLSGSDKGNQKYIREVVDFYKLSDDVLFTGFVTNEEIYTFYKNAIALVMPTFLGPTNMPILEAFYLDCPILCSDLEGHQEQVGDYASYFDPKNHQEIAQKMLDVFSEECTNKRKSPRKAQKVASLIEQHLLDLVSVRKIFGYDF